MFAIGDDIDEWINKLKNHLEYMSDIITAVKGQAVTFSENSIISFGIEETFKHVEILMQHDLKHSLVNLYTNNEVPEEIKLKGNMNGLVQVIDNLISNAIYAYKSMNKTDQVIDLSAKYIKSKHSIEIRVKDYGPGLPKDVQKKLFKEMITTKGKEGTGLGLFMSASNIKAQFKGTMDFETKEGKGTTFIINLPVIENVNN
jgi:signal transduction histidine kinase